MLRKPYLCGDPNSAPRCGAKTRSSRSCRGPAMKNGRCRMHGGTSTGPTTPEGLARARKGNWKHGGFSREFVERQKVELASQKWAEEYVAKLFRKWSGRG